MVSMWRSVFLLSVVPFAGASTFGGREKDQDTGGGNKNPRWADLSELVDDNFAWASPSFFAPSPSRPPSPPPSSSTPPIEVQEEEDAEASAFSLLKRGASGSSSTSLTSSTSSGAASSSSVSPPGGSPLLQCQDASVLRRQVDAAQEDLDLHTSVEVPPRASSAAEADEAGDQGSRAAAANEDEGSRLLKLRTKSLDTEAEGHDLQMEGRRGAERTATKTHVPPLTNDERILEATAAKLRTAAGMYESSKARLGEATSILQGHDHEHPTGPSPLLAQQPCSSAPPPPPPLHLPPGVHLPPGPWNLHGQDPPPPPPLPPRAWNNHGPQVDEDAGAITSNKPAAAQALSDVELLHQFQSGALREVDVDDTMRKQLLARHSALRQENDELWRRAGRQQLLVSEQGYYDPLLLSAARQRCQAAASEQAAAEKRFKDSLLALFGKYRARLPRGGSLEEDVVGQRGLFLDLLLNSRIDPQHLAKTNAGRRTLRHGVESSKVPATAAKTAVRDFIKGALCSRSPSSCCPCAGGCSDLSSEDPLHAVSEIFDVRKLQRREAGGEKWTTEAPKPISLRDLTRAQGLCLYFRMEFGCWPCRAGPDCRHKAETGQGSCTLCHKCPATSPDYEYQRYGVPISSNSPTQHQRFQRKFWKTLVTGKTTMSPITESEGEEPGKEFRSHDHAEQGDEELDARVELSRLLDEAAKEELELLMRTCCAADESSRSAADPNCGGAAGGEGRAGTASSSPTTSSPATQTLPPGNFLVSGLTGQPQQDGYFYQENHAGRPPEAGAGFYACIPCMPQVQEEQTSWGDACGAQGNLMQTVGWNSFSQQPYVGGQADSTAGVYFNMDAASCWGHWQWQQQEQPGEGCCGSAACYAYGCCSTGDYGHQAPASREEAGAFESQHQELQAHHSFRGDAAEFVPGAAVYGSSP